MLGKFSFGTSGQQILERNYDDVTHVEYRSTGHRVLPVELQFRLHERCAELLAFARGVMMLGLPV